MTKQDEIRSIEAELSFLQNEIDRRYARVREDASTLRNVDKIDRMRDRKHKLQARLEQLN